MTRGRLESDHLAMVVERLSALVGAGVSPPQAWRYLGEVAPHPLVVAVVLRLDGGASVPDALASAAGASLGSAVGGAAGAAVVGGAGTTASGGSGVGGASGGRGAALPRSGEGAARPGRRRHESASWRVVAAAWAVATTTGSPLARCLDEIAGTLRALAQAERETAAALASPKATTRLVMVLPLVSVAGCALLGLDTIPVLFTTVAGGACLVAGIGLTALGALWSRRLVRRSTPTSVAPGLLLDLTAVAVSGGGALPAARALVIGTLERLTPEAGARGGSAELAILDEVLSLAERSGAPPARLLRSEAVRVRRDAVTDAQRRTAELGVWLMLPLGVCVLPAFILLAVVPVLLSVLPTTPMP